MTTSYDIETTIHPNGVVEIHGIETPYELDKYGDRNLVMCTHCGRVWDDSVSSDVTPVPSGRCPFEYDHVSTDDPEILSFLAAGGYNSPEDWARDSDYHFADGSWRDEDDEMVDVLGEITGAMEASAEDDGHDLLEVLARKQAGVDCTEDESVLVLSYFRESEGLDPESDPYVAAFPLEWDQHHSDKLAERLEWAGVPEDPEASDAELFIAANPSMGEPVNDQRIAVLQEHAHSAVRMADTIIRERAERNRLAAAVAEVWAEDMPSTYRNRKVCELVRETLDTGELPTDRRVEKLRTANAMLADSLNTMSAENRRREQEIETLRQANGNQFRIIQTIREIDPEMVRRIQDGEV